MSADAILDEDAGIFRVSKTLLARAEATEGVLASALGPSGKRVAATVEAAVSEPVARIVVEVLEPNAKRCKGWLAEHAAVIAVPVGPDEPLCDVIVVPPAALPLRLAKLVALGPRPNPDPDAGVVVGRSNLDALLGGAEPLRDVRSELALVADVPTEVEQALAAIVPNLRLHWRVTVAWELEGDPVERSLEVVDAGSAGLWLVVDAGTDEEGRAGVGLLPGSATAVWTLLASLMPSDEEFLGIDTTTVELDEPDDEADAGQPGR